MPDISIVDGPLKDLFTSKYNYKLLQYPADLNSSAKGHSVKFDIYNVQSTELKDVTKYVSETWDKTVSTANQLTTAEGIKKVGEDAVAGIEKAAKKLQNNPDGIGGVLKEVITEFSSPKKSYETTVSLYMPDTIDFAYGVTYDSQTSLISAAASAPVVGTIAKAITGVMDNNAAKMALKQFGYAFNPQAQMMFESIDFRTYSMSFTFTPRSAKEAEQVKEIIKTFRKHAAPTVVNASAGFFFKPPSIFNVSFWSNGVENTNINRITDSVIESVDVNYAPNGWSAHKDGKPVQVTMSLNFKEITLVDRTKIENGY